MKTLAEAWAWYEATKQHAKLVRRLVGHHWEVLPDDPVFEAGRVRLLEGATVVQNTLDDLAVVVFFSVFEAIVRQHVLDEIGPEQQLLTHPVLIAAAGDASERVEVGSFARVLEPYKSPGLADLIEQVNQVRRYRNWVAHGKRASGTMPARVVPDAAYERLTAFLAAIRGGEE